MEHEHPSHQLSSSQLSSSQLAAAEAHVRAARSRAIMWRPYFGRALEALILVASPQCPTMAVDPWARLYYGPRFALSCDVDELAVVFLHEIAHLLRRHHERATQLGVTFATHELANIAMDCEINDDIAEEVAWDADLRPLPGEPFYPRVLGLPEGRSWEEYYHRLLSRRERARQQAEAEGEEPSAGEEGGGKAGIGKGGSDERYDCGSGATGVRRSWEWGAPDEGGGEGIEGREWAEIEREVARAIRRWNRCAVRGSWSEWADEVLRVERIPWREELSQACRRAASHGAGAVVHSYVRPSRRQHALPSVVLPTMRRPLPRIALVGDTSGSMDADQLAIVRGVVDDVCRAFRAAIEFFPTDAAASEPQRVDVGQRIEMRGRGGTDMGAGIAAAISSPRGRPDLVVVATDCDTPWPDEEPSVPVVICAIRASATAVAACPGWARVIRVVEIE